MARKAVQKAGKGKERERNKVEKAKLEAIQRCGRHLHRHELHGRSSLLPKSGLFFDLPLHINDSSAFFVLNLN